MVEKETKAKGFHLECSLKECKHVEIPGGVTAPEKG
jgi:hypothetical protein